MFFVISKILKFLIYPLTWVIAMLVGSSIAKKKCWRRGLLIGGLAILLVFTDKPLLQWTRYAMSNDYIEQQVKERHYAVAVIMGGFGQMNVECGQLESVDDRSARLWEPYRLWQMGVVDKLMISGDATIAINKQGHSTAENFRQYMAELGVPDSCLILEQRARNTRENATYSIAILDSLGYKDSDCLLVTSATHMKRSLACFNTLGWNPDTYAVNIYSKPKPIAKEFIPQWRTLLEWQEVVNELFGIVVYRIMGY